MRRLIRQEGRRAGGQKGKAKGKGQKLVKSSLGRNLGSSRFKKKGDDLLVY